MDLAPGGIRMLSLPLVGDINKYKDCERCGAAALYSAGSPPGPGYHWASSRRNPRLHSQRLEHCEGTIAEHSVNHWRCADGQRTAQLSGTPQQPAPRPCKRKGSR